jgi:hypothetical protein
MLKLHDPHFGLAAKCSNYIMLHFNVILLHAMRKEHIMFDFSGHKNCREHSECGCLLSRTFLQIIDGFIALMIAH